MDGSGAEQPQITAPDANDAAAAPVAVPGAPPADVTAGTATPAATDGPHSDPKPPRVVQQKTPAQKEALEAAFQANHFPDEATRKGLAAATGLNESQISTWFSHRRRKERTSGRHVGPPPAAPAALFPSQNGAAAAAGAAVAGDAFMDPGSDSEGHDDVDPSEMDPGERQRLAEYEELLAAGRAILGEVFRGDGPPLGLEFDDIPSATQPYGKGKRRRAGEEDPDFEMGGGGGKRAKAMPRPRPTTMEDLEKLRREEEVRAAVLAERARQQMERLESSIRKEQERYARERERQDSRLAREREKELARLEGERRKHLERVMREQKKEEERRAKEEARLRAMAEREERRLAAVREKEMRAEEKRREKEERRKEREMLKALTQQERAAMRLRSRETAGGPKDDLDLEWERMMAEYRRRAGLAADAPAPAEGSAPPEGCPSLPARPPFPPPEVDLRAALVDGEGRPLDPDAAAEMLSAWAVLAAFPQLLALADVPTADALAAALAQGLGSELLAQVHVGLLRLLQADAEEAYATGEGVEGPHRGGGGSGGAAAATAAAEHAVAAGAKLLEESWAWGFDVDAWRAHLGPLTWPEVAREMAIAAGLGRRRPQHRRRETLARIGTVGEDIVLGSAAGHDKLELRLPPRLAAGTVKGAAWLVLKDAGPEGMHVEEIARQIQGRGLRDLRTSKTPEVSVSGALARDVLFDKVAPATYALQSVRAHFRKLQQSGEVKKEAEGKGPGEGGEQQQQQEQQQTPDKDAKQLEQDVKTEEEDLPEEHEEQQQHEEEEESEGEDDAAEEERLRRNEAHAGESWVASLKEHGYNELPLDQRVFLLSALCQLALESPTVRAVVDSRLEEQQRIRRMIWIDSKAEATQQRQRRAAEQAAKLKAQAEEAKARLAAMGDAAQQPMDVDGGAGATAAPPIIDDAAHAAAQAAVAAATAEASHLQEDREAAAKRGQAKAEAALREMEANSVRAEPLGLDRRHNRYWRFVRGRGALAAAVTSTGHPPDPNFGRVYVENHEDGTLRMVSTPDALNALMAALDRRGAREGKLLASLMRHKDSFMAAMPAAPLALSPIIISEDSSAASKLKSDLLALHSSLPEGAIDAEAAGFHSAAWEAAVAAAEDAAALRRCLGQLEDAISPAVLHSNYSKDPLLVKGAWIPVGGEVATARPGSTAAEAMLPASPALGAAADQQQGTSDQEQRAPEPPGPLAWLPPTISAVALRLESLTAAIKFDGATAARDTADGYHRVLRPGRLPGARPDGVLLGSPLSRNGLVAPSFFPVFPHRMLFTPRVDFSFDVAKFQQHVATGNDDVLVVAAAARGKGVGRGARGRSRAKPKGRAGAGGGGERGGAGRRGGGKGRGGGGGGGCGATTGGHRSALGRELGAQSDSERHYGSGLDDDEDDDEYMSRMPSASGRPSAAPSAAPSTAADDDDEEISAEDGATVGGDEDSDQDMD